MTPRGRFILLAASAIGVYAVASYLLILPEIKLPRAVNLADVPAPMCGSPTFMDSVRTEQLLLFVPLARVPEHLLMRLFEQEDAFYHHGGVDWLQAARALGRNIAAGQYRYGASTLTMQLVRELFLGKDRTVGRKAREVAYALQAERRLSKDAILELYLNVVHWGPGIRGIGAASCYYFGVPPAALSPQEAADLVAVLPSPERLGSALHARRAETATSGDHAEPSSGPAP